MKKLVIISILISVSATIAGQNEEVILPSDLKQQTIITEPPTLWKGFLRVGLVTSFGAVDKYFNNENNKTYFPESAWASSWSFMLLAQYGVTDRLTVEFWLPYGNEVRNYFQVWLDPGNEINYENSWDLKGNGLGDISFSSRYQFLKESVSFPSLTGSLDLTIPTGEKNPTDIKGNYDYKLPAGYGEYVLSGELRAKKIRYPYSYIAYISYLYHFPGSKMFNAMDTEESEFKSGDRLNLGLSFNFHLNDWIAIANEANYFYNWKGEQENVSPDDLFTNWAVSYEGRLVFQIKRIRLAEAVRFPVMGRNVSADPLYILLVQYTF